MVTRIPFSTLQPIGLMTIGLEAVVLVYMGSTFEVDISMLFLTAAVLLSGFCVILGHPRVKLSSPVLASTMIILGLSLGVLLSNPPLNRIFLIGILGYVAVSFVRVKRRSLRTAIILLHLAVAIIFSLGFVIDGQTLSLLGGLFLAVTFLPLVPFHLPFVAMVGAAKGSLSSFWLVAWLTLGLAELHRLQTSLPQEILLALHLLAVGSAVYASLMCLGQKLFRLFVAYATVAHLALVWGLFQVFSNFSHWGIPFGVAVAFLMSALCIAFSFVRHRYGWHALGTFSGLASPMPRLGHVMIILTSLGMVLPLFPTFSGLMTMPTIANQDVSSVMMLFTFLTVWLGGGWYFSQMLHQTTFGRARSDVSYTDLRIAEIIAVAFLILGATYSGVIY